MAEAVAIGAIIGAGISSATGRDWKKGAMFGAVGGLAGHGVSLYQYGSKAATGTSAAVGGAAGGVFSGIRTKRHLPKFETPKQSPVPTTVLAGERAQSLTDKLKKRKRYRTAMTGDYGDLSLGKAGMLGV